MMNPTGRISRLLDKAVKAGIDVIAFGVDPCGENGEFHPFVYDGPMFSRSVPVKTGDVVAREGFVFADLLPA